MVEERLAGIPNGHPLNDIFVHPSIIGCLDYGVVSKSERKSTIFVVDIIRIKDGDVASMALADCPIPARELVAVVVDVRAD